MSKAEDYIKKRTRGTVNHITENFPWIPTNEALEAVEIAREEIYEWLNKNLSTYIDYRCRGVGKSVEEFVNDLKQAIKDE